jgi:hypothetical protein
MLGLQKIRSTAVWMIDAETELAYAKADDLFPSPSPNLSANPAMTHMFPDRHIG